MGKKRGPKKGVMPPQLKAYWEGKRNKSTGSATTMAPKRKRSRKASTSAPKRRRGVSSVFGNIGLVGMLGGGLSLFGAKWLVRKYFPQLGNYVAPVAAVGAGAIGKTMKIPGTGSLMLYGLLDGVSELAADAVSPGGLYTLPGIGAATGTQARGYEY